MPHYKLKEKVTFTCINCGEIKILYYNPNQSFGKKPDKGF